MDRLRFVTLPLCGLIIFNFHWVLTDLPQAQASKYTLRYYFPNHCARKYVDAHQKLLPSRKVLHTDQLLFFGKFDHLLVQNLVLRNLLLVIDLIPNSQFTDSEYLVQKLTHFYWFYFVPSVCRGLYCWNLNHFFWLSHLTGLKFATRGLSVTLGLKIRKCDP
jgi:hypothetical protein